MSMLNIENLRFSSSSIDDFFGTPPILKTASSGKTRLSSLVQLSGFQIVAVDKLVRVSQQDMWKLGQDNEGYYIERLLDDSDGPVLGT